MQTCCKQVPSCWAGFAALCDDAVTQKTWLSRVAARAAHPDETPVRPVVQPDGPTPVRLRNGISLQRGRVSGQPVTQPDGRLFNRRPVVQPDTLGIRAEHIYPLWGNNMNFEL